MNHSFASRASRFPWVLLTGVAALCVPPSAHAVVTFIGAAVLDGRGTDLSGLAGVVESGARQNGLDGFGSGIAYTGFDNTYLLLCDRGPSNTPYTGSGKVDDTTSFKTRYESFRINLTGSGNSYTVSATNTATTLLKNELGANFLGRSDAFTPGAAPSDNLRMDPESIRVARDGSVYVSDEYGPTIYHFSSAGTRLESLPIPAKFQIGAFTYNGKGASETAGNTQGRVDNKGLEGIAITPDGTHLLAMMQAPLIQDGGDNTRRTRMLYYDLTNPAAAPKEFLYQLNRDTNFPGLNVSNTSVSDVVAINDHQFLVDEREGGNTGKRAYIIDINNAVDISASGSISGLTETEAGNLAVTKGAEFMSLKGLTNNYFATNPQPAGYTALLPDNVEGFTFGPDLPDGRRLLLITNDNNYLNPLTLSGGYPNYIMAFAVDRADIPGYVAQQFNAVPEPASAALLLFGGALLGFRRLRPSRRD